MDLVEATAFWQKLDVPGHDAARLSKAGDDGWRLSGAAVFLHDGMPAALSYDLALAGDWSTRAARIRGSLGTRPVDLRILRETHGWIVNGRAQALGGLVHLDLGFTPATNLMQLAAMRLSIGESADMPVAWLDVGSDRLEALSQHYRRTEAACYAYHAPRFGYAAELLIAETGFVADYPGLWRLIV